MEATPSTPSYTDTMVVAGTTYTYVVKAIDNSANVSLTSASVTQTAQLRTMHVVHRDGARVDAGEHERLHRHVREIGHVDWDDGHIIPFTSIGGNQWPATVDAGVDVPRVQVHGRERRFCGFA
jgi:hypothetical protein